MKLQGRTTLSTPVDVAGRFTPLVPARVGGGFRARQLAVSVSRAHTSLHLRELIALVDRVPGSWRTILIAWGGATAAIDVALDLFGISGILKT